MFDTLSYTVKFILISVLITPVHFLSATLYCWVNIFNVILNIEKQHNTFYGCRLGIKSACIDYIEHISLIREYYKL